MSVMFAERAVIATAKNRISKSQTGVDRLLYLLEKIIVTTYGPGTWTPEKDKVKSVEDVLEWLVDAIDYEHACEQHLTDLKLLYELIYNLTCCGRVKMGGCISHFETTLFTEWEYKANDPGGDIVFSVGYKLVLCRSFNKYQVLMNELVFPESEADELFSEFKYNLFGEDYDFVYFRNYITENLTKLNELLYKYQ